jgi:anti-sigma factor RsiW
MKPCSRNRPFIAWLALGCLEARHERELRPHLETCEGCRDYLAQMSAVTKTLLKAEAASEATPSSAFHRRLVTRLCEAESNSAWHKTVEFIRSVFSNPRFAFRMAAVLPVFAIIGVAIALLFAHLHRPQKPQPAHEEVQVAAQVVGSKDFVPTMLNYQMAANDSIDRFEDLLSRQGNRNPAPAPVYTAATRWSRDGLE